MRTPGGQAANGTLMTQAVQQAAEGKLTPGELCAVQGACPVRGEDRETCREAPRPVLPLRWNSASRSETAFGFGVHGGRQRPL